MKLFIFLISILFSRILIASAPDQSVVDQWISLALHLDEKDLQGKGRWQCQYILGDEQSLIVFGKDKSEASTRLSLNCLKNQCANIGSKIANGIDKVLGLNDQELTALLQGSGFSEADRQIILQHKQKSTQASQVDLNCTNITPTARLFVFDMCFAVPMKCSRSSVFWKRQK